MVIDGYGELCFSLRSAPPDVYKRQAHNRAGTGMSAGPFFTHGAAGLRPSVSSNPALSGFHSVQEKSEARWMYERLLAFCIRFFLNKNKKFLLELCRTGIKDAMPHIPDSVVSVSAF